MQGPSLRKLRREKQVVVEKDEQKGSRIRQAQLLRCLRRRNIVQYSGDERRARAVDAFERRVVRLSRRMQGDAAFDVNSLLHPDTSELDRTRSIQEEKKQLRQQRRRKQNESDRLQQAALEEATELQATLKGIVVNSVQAWGESVRLAEAERRAACLSRWKKRQQQLRFREVCYSSIVCAVRVITLLAACCV